jgi:membrane associated rhomboid family serine protease
MAVCYRHPGRETGVACSSCGRPICPDCMTPTPVGMRCPECARQRTRVTRLRDARSEPTLTYALIAINVIVEIAAVASGASAGGGGGGTLEQHGWLSREYIANGDYWRLVTSGFLHAGFFHLLINMYVLYVLGSLLEPAIGRPRFGLIYAVSLLCGSLGVVIAQPSTPTVGASGAIFGLMGAAVVILRGRGAGQLQTTLLFWIALNLLLTFTISNISVGGHIGGLVGGVLTAIVLFELPTRARLPAFAGSLLAGALGAGAVVAAIAVAG